MDSSSIDIRDSRRTYRLPGGPFGDGEIVASYAGYELGLHRYIGQPVEGVGAFTLLVANRLVEVRPPSIDDPVGLPLELHYDHDASGRTRDGSSSQNASLWFKEDINGWTLAQIYEHGVEGWSRPVRLNVSQLRLLAQAAWQRANAVEAGERS